jgi:hypothetical protein
LNRTPSVAGNRTTWTWSGWVKLGVIGALQQIFNAGVSGTNFTGIQTTAASQIEIFDYASAYNFDLITTQVFRDPSAWYHVVVAFDTTQATSTNRVKLYINGAQVTAFGTASYPVLNSSFAINNNVSHQISRSVFSSSNYFDGYLAEVNFIDGQALTPSSFGSTNSLTGVWQPARYTGSYGTNGFYLPFTDNSALTTASNVGLGKDFSGNGNYWTTNNISITAGVTYDSMTDVPTLTSATASNFAVLNPLDFANSNLVASNANLTCTNNGGTGNAQIRASIALPSSGKFYWETKNTGSANNFSMGLTTLTASLSTEGAGDILYNENGVINNNGTTTSGYATLALGDIVGVTVDVDANKIYWYKNNTLVNSGGTTINISAPFSPMFGFYTSGNAQSVTFGQRPFSYTPPTGFVALNTYNLPTSTIVKGNTVMDATIYTGDGTTPKSQTNAAGFKPDFVWIKSRSSAYSHNLFDSVRGAGAARSLQTDNTKSESDVAVDTALYGYLSSFNSNGFSTTNGSTTPVWVNASGGTYVAWQWQAGQGSSSSNTNGSITSTVSVNASAGFSVVTYTGNGTSGATVGHGLGVTPTFIIVKTRSVGSQDWRVYTATIGNTGVLDLNTTNAAVTGQSGFWNNTSPTSSVFSLGGAASTNGSGTTYVAYCWTPIAGFSAFGSYTGNGSADGTFVYTGFRPKWVMVKGSSFVSNWFIEDSARNGYNVNDGVALRPNLSNAEDGTTTYNIDILSNGFKLRSSAGDSNTSGATFIYAAFAENPTKNALAR